MGELTDAAVAAQGVTAEQRRKMLGQIADLLERNNIDVADVGKVHRVNLWQQGYKDAEGVGQVQDLVGVQLSPQWADGPLWPVVQPAAPTVIRAARSAARQDSVTTTVFLPDPQIGFWNVDGELIAMHDVVAMEVALQLCALIRPDRIVNHGDTLDFAEWSSKFLRLPEFALTTQATIDTGHVWLARQRATCPDAEILLFEGNHDNRLANWIATNAMAALRLRRANAPDEWPVLSIENLLRLDELGVDYIGGYPAGARQITKGGGGVAGLWAKHGEGAGDIVKVAKSSRRSVVQGHGHRQGITVEQYEDDDGRPVKVYVFSAGCLCRTDGFVPSTKGGQVHGRPVTRWENWHQGIGIAYERDDGFWTPELVPITHGRAEWRGKTVETKEQS